MLNYYSWAPGVLFVLLTAIVYWPTLGNRFVWDDDDYVQENGTLSSPAGLNAIWSDPAATPQYYPLVHTSYWIEHALWGLNPRGYHIDNLLLHAVAALLVWRLLVRLAVPGAWLAAAFFAVHPVEVESVAWITERKNVLSCVFALGSMLAYLRFAPPTPQTSLATDNARTRTNGAYYALAFVLYAAALLSKTVTATVPAVLLVIYWWKQGKFSWREAASLLPFFALGLALSAVTISLEETQVGAVGESWNLSPFERVLIAGRAVWFYAGKLAWPHPLIFFYPRWIIDASVAWQYLFPASAVGAIVTLWLARRRIGRGPLAAVLIFVGVLTPALGFFNVYPFQYSFVADHFQYHASIALIALAAALLVTTNGYFMPSRQRLGWFGGCCLLAILALVAQRRTHAFQDRQTLLEDTLAQNPTAWVVPLNLGYVLFEEGKYDESIPLFQSAVKIRQQLADDHPKIGHYQDGLAACLDQLSTAQHKAKRFADATTSRGRAIAIRESLVSAHPTILEYANRLAGSYVELGTIERDERHALEAETAFTRALAIRLPIVRDAPKGADYSSDLAWAYAHLALAQRDLGKTSAADASQREALAIRTSLVEEHPNVITYRANLAQNYVDLGVLQRDLKQGGEAEKSFQTAIDLREQIVREAPQDRDYREDLGWSYVQRALAQQSQGKAADALASHRRALEIREKLAAEHPNVGKYRNDVAASYVDLGYLLPAEEAVLAYRKAIAVREQLIREQPTEAQYQQSLAATYQLLASAYQSRGKLVEALATRKRLCEVREQLAAARPEESAAAAASYVDLAFLERNLGKRSEAEIAFRKAIALREQALDSGKADDEVRAHLAGTYIELAIDEREDGRTAESIASCQKAIGIYEALRVAHPTAADVTAGLGWAFANLGVAQIACGDAAEAVDACRKSVAIRELLVRDQPELNDHKLTLEAGLGWSYANLGVALSLTGELAEAENCLRKAIQIRAKLVLDNSTAVDHQHEIALSCRDLASVKRAMGKTDDAIILYRAAIEIREPLVAANPGDVAFRLQLARDLRDCGTLLAAADELTESARMLERAEQLTAAAATPTKE
jgi:tetratricopeptide (TPR) repeat protein